MPSPEAPAFKDYMFNPLDYTFEILIGLCALYGTVVAYVNYFKTNTSVMNEDELIEAYINLERARCLKQRK